MWVERLRFPRERDDGDVALYRLGVGALRPGRGSQTFLLTEMELKALAQSIIGVKGDDK